MYLILIANKTNKQTKTIDLLLRKAVFWDVAPYGLCKNRRIGGKYHLNHQFNKILRTGNNVVPSSPILVTLMMEAILSSENVDSYQSYTA
jgi:hypothetical protein